MNIVIKEMPLERKEKLITLLKKSPKNSSILIISKDELDRLNYFYKEKTFYLNFLDGKLYIQKILAFGNVVIKDYSNRISGNVKQRFNIAKSYVVTTKRSILDVCHLFYSKIKSFQKESKVIFGITKEVNLQKELNIKVNDEKESTNVIETKENPTVKIVSRQLRFKDEGLPSVNTETSFVLSTSLPAKEGLKATFVKHVPTILKKSGDIDSGKNIGKVKVKKAGYAIFTILSLIVILGSGVIAYLIVYRMFS